MPRHINADKVMEEIERIGGHNLCEWNTIGVKALIDRQPTADVVEVVRCKDCKHCDVIYPLKYAGAEATVVYFCGFNNVPRKAYDFCSYGERKE